MHVAGSRLRRAGSADIFVGSAAKSARCRRRRQTASKILGTVLYFPAKHFFKMRRMPRVWQGRDSAALGAPTSSSAAQQGPHAAAGGGKPRLKYWGQTYIFPTKHFSRRADCRACGRVATPPRWECRRLRRLRGKVRTLPQAAGKRAQNIGDSLIFSPQNTFQDTPIAALVAGWRQWRVLREIRKKTHAFMSPSCHAARSEIAPYPRFALKIRQCHAVRNQIHAPHSSIRRLRSAGLRRVAGM